MVSAMLRSSSRDFSDPFGSFSSGSSEPSTEGLFKALGGGNLAGGVDAILREERVRSAKMEVFSKVELRLGYMRDGKYDPSSDWEKLAGYAMATGKPLVIGLGDGGTPAVELQSEAYPGPISPGSMRSLFSSISAADAMAQKIRANEKNEEWIAKLSGAPLNLRLVTTSVLPPQTVTENDWEARGVALTREHRPFSIVLDAKGALTVVDQASDVALLDIPFPDQRRLSAAIASIPETIRDGTAFYDWELEARRLSEDGRSFHLEIDSVTREIKTVENTSETVVPDFLRKPPYPNVGADDPFLEGAAELIKARKAWFVSMRGGQPVAMELTARNMYNSEQVRNGSGVGSGLSLFA
jgi:hypothetical protein